MLSLGIIGLGAVSRFYVEAAELVDGLTLTGVCDIRPERLRPFEQEPGVATYDDVARLLADENVDAVVVDTPVASHPELCRAALDAGKHVCCEKPLAVRRADAAALLELAERRGLTLFTAFHRRYNRRLPSPESIARGEVVFAESRYLEQIADHADDAGWYTTPASAGGGCIVDNGPNAYDVVRHLLGDVTVTHAHVTRSDAGVDMQAVVHGRAGQADVVIRLEWDYDGERKDVLLRFRDGSELHADLLDGFDGFKASLQHEYVGVLQDFAAHVAARRQDTLGLAATAWLDDVLRLTAGA